MSSIISMKALLESGVHFGHRTNKWNPLMRPYIFTERNGIHIIDLQQTVKLLTTAYNLVRDTAAKGGNIMFVGTKRQAQETIAEEAIRCGMPYVTERWLGGMITNWSTMLKRIQEMERLERLRDSGEIHRLTKKEGLLIERDIKRLNIRLSGVRNMKRTPDLLFVVDVVREHTAVHEANIRGIPVIAMLDTNCDPRNIDYVIPSNDDAIRAIKLLVGKIADAVIEGRTMMKDEDGDGGMIDGTTVRTPSAARPRMEEEDELEDTDLLGASTLAKLGDKADEEEVVEEEVKPVKKVSKVVDPEDVEEEKEEVKEVKKEKKVVVEETAEPEAAAPKKAAKPVEEPTKEEPKAEKKTEKAEAVKPVAEKEKPAKKSKKADEVVETVEEDKPAKKTKKADEVVETVDEDKPTKKSKKVDSE